jgi:hypothetical protein
VVVNPTTTALNDLFASVALAVCLFSALRAMMTIRAKRFDDLDVDVSHVIMGAAMAGMLASPLNVLSNQAGVVIFLLIAGFFVASAISARRRSVVHHHHHVLHYPVHAMMALAMSYMYWLNESPGSAHQVMAMGTAPINGDPGFTALFVLALGVSAVWNIDALSRFNRIDASGIASARGEIVSHVLMCATMGYMLVLML